MKTQSISRLLVFPVALSAMVASAEVMDRPVGIKIGQRMTLKPYVSLSIGWDSNVSARHSNPDGDAVWTVNPGLVLDYRAENWALALTGYYNYHGYFRGDHVNDRNQHSFGENLRWNWANCRGSERGWSMMLSQSFRQINMADDMSLGDGRGYSADRREFDISGGIRRNFNEHWHASVNAGYYMIQYDNDLDSGASMYGWQRWTAGAEAGFAPSRWTDILIAAGYQGYDQDNVKGSLLSRDSQGFSVQGGIGSYATERISYRALAGWSRFEYAGNSASNNGFVYTLSGNWKISDTLHTMLLATSYYQPSEREYASRSRVDSVSWGLGKSFIRGKLNATFDLSYRHETIERVNSSVSDYALDIVSGRLGLNYTLNRYLGLFCYGEYQRSWNSESERNYGYNDYDRWRVTGGMRITY